MITHNFGSVDSIGVVKYCAGRIRYSSPQARFLLHGVTLNFQGSFSFEEPQLEEKLKSLKIDIENIAKVISINVGKNVDEVTQTLINRTTLNPDQAKDWGLVHDIKTEMFPLGSQVVSIQG